MSALIGFGLFVLQLAVMPLLSGSFMARAAGVPRADRTAFLLYGMGLWSAVSALAVDLTLRFLPGLPQQAYVLGYATLVLVVAGGALLTNMRAAPEVGPRPAFLSGLREHWSALDVYGRAAVGLVVGICLFFLVQNLSEPLTGNDAIVHTLVARILARDMSAASYPLATADPVTGFLLEGVHPLGFPASKALFMILLGDLDTPWHKPLTAVYFIYLLLAVGTLSCRIFGTATAAFSMLLVAFTPLLINSLATVHIDPLRVHGFFLCLALLAEFARRGERYWLPLGTLALVETLHSHAGNLMLLAFVGPLFLLAAPGSLWKRILLGAALSVPAIVLVSPQFLINLRTYGVLLGVDYALERLHPEPFLLWISIQRSLMTVPDIVWNGALAPFTDPGWFALTFWLGAAGIALVIAQGQHRRPPVCILIGIVLIYAAVMCLAVLMRYKPFYMNTRYMLVLLPPFAVFGGYLFQRLLQAEAIAPALKPSQAARRSSPRLSDIERILVAFLVVPAMIALYQVLMSYAREAVTTLGMASSLGGNDSEIVWVPHLLLATPVILAVPAGLIVARQIQRRYRDGKPAFPAWLVASASAESSCRKLARPLQLLWALAIVAPIGLLVLPPLVRIYGGLAALGMRLLIKALTMALWDVPSAIAGMALLAVIAVLIVWRWRTGRFPKPPTYRLAYSLLILCALAWLGYVFLPVVLAVFEALEAALREAWPKLGPGSLSRFVALTAAALPLVASAAIWLGFRLLWSRRAAIGVWVERSRLPAGAWATISYLFVPLLIANVHFGLGSLRGLIHPGYMKPPLAFRSDIAKAESTRTAGDGIEYLEPSLYLRDLARSPQGPEVRTLTFRDSEIFAYGGGSILSGYDRRIWDLYATRSAEEAYRLLQQKSIGYLYSPNYSSPTNNFNGVGEILTRRDLLRIARQSAGSVFTLFEVATEPGRVTAEEIFRGDPSEPIVLSKRAFELFPAGLANCDGLRFVRANIFSWYWSQVTARMTRAGCVEAMADKNWILMPSAREGETYRLEADLASIGCAGLRVLHRIPPTRPGDDYSISTSDFMHFALKPGEKAVLWFQRPLHSDAIGVGFYGGCGQPSAVSAFHVERLVEKPQ